MRIGVDLGGTKIEAAALDDQGLIAVRRRISTPKNDAMAIVHAVVNIALAIEEEVGERATIGVATPGVISPTTGLMKNSNTTCLNGEPLDRMLTEALDREIRVANDANCFALSEAVDGAAAGAHVVFGVIVGTGTGGGIVVGRRALRGTNSIAGEWGHNPLPWSSEEDRPAAECYCGQVGCLETYLSGAGLARDHEARTGDVHTAVNIAERAAAGDVASADTVRRYASRLARGLASVINVLDPDVVVLGGGLSNIAALYELVPPLLSRWVFSDGVRTKLVQNLHGDSSGVRGAAWLWPPCHGQGQGGR